MKITAVEVTVTHLPKDIPPTNSRPVYAPVIQVHTDEGITGVSAGTFNGSTEIALIGALGEKIVGEDPRQPEAIHRKLAPLGAWVPRGSETFAPAAALLDIAVWDILGKVAGQPLWRLLGGNTNHKPAYATTRMQREVKAPGPLAEAAAKCVAEGFRYMKMNLGAEHSTAAEVLRVKTVRETVGRDVRIMIDVNNMFTPTQALEVGRRIAEYDVFWLEDPIPVHNIGALVELRRELPFPIATGETLTGLNA